MKRAVAFCQVIEPQGGKAKTHKVSSKQIAGMFKEVVDAYREQENSDNDLLCEAAHVDGTMNASEKEEKLQWLKAEPGPNTCRILSNVRCLSEGVDVPALDAVLFLTPRNSQVDVVQSVGRVMRNAPGKERGYLVLPVVIPSGMEPHEALNDNKVYKVAWDVLQALRSHDDTFDAFVNKLEFDGQNKRKMEVIAITDKTSKKSESVARKAADTNTPEGKQIKPEELPHKYKHAIHANEIVLLAYYIAAINIEAVYHGIMKEHREVVSPLQGSDASGPDTRGVAPGWHVSPFQGGDAAAPTNDPTQHDGPNAPTGQDISAQGNALGSTPHQDQSPEGAAYEPFEGICLTDSFQMYEKDDLISNLLTDNSDRRKRQKKLDIRVIMGNPPYSAGQESANDNNQNVAYPDLDGRVRDTYAAKSKMTSVKTLYDSYIRAIRWASDQLKECGIIGFVSNASFLESNTCDGLRACLRAEFSSIYVFYLRGNQRTSGELSRKEGGKIFGSGSRAPISITLLVKDLNAKEAGRILWHDIGDYLSQKEKLEIIQGFGSTTGITDNNAWTKIKPDSHNDWVSQRDESFDHFIQIGSNKAQAGKVVFANYSLGVATGRDRWCCGSSSSVVEKNLNRMISNYNSEVLSMAKLNENERDSFVPNSNEEDISWNRNLKNGFDQGVLHNFDGTPLYKCLYRPYSRQWLYFEKGMNAMI